jgi:hypothetical protein
MSGARPEAEFSILKHGCCRGAVRLGRRFIAQAIQVRSNPAEALADANELLAIVKATTSNTSPSHNS